MISAWTRPSRPPRLRGNSTVTSLWCAWRPGLPEPRLWFQVRHFQNTVTRCRASPNPAKWDCFCFFFSDQDVTNLAFWQTPRFVICPVSSMTVRAVAGGDGLSGYSEHPSVQVSCIWENEGNWWGFIIPFYYDLTNTMRKNKTRGARWGRGW